MQLDLNGRYCLASKLHYEKLINDGCIATPFDGHKYMQIMDGYVRFTDNPLSICKPMHLHNNEWVFGSLEHEEMDEVKCCNCGWSGLDSELAYCYDGDEPINGCPTCQTDSYLADYTKPKPIVHTTNETLLEDLSLNELKEITAKHEKEAANKYRKDAPKVERITRENVSHNIHTLLGKYICSMYNRDEATDMIMHIFDEYLEANQKDK